LEEFRRVVESLDFGPVRPGVAVVSGLTGGVVGGGELGVAEYWVRHAREAVRFADGVGAVRGLGVSTLVEVGPHAVLTGMAGECLEETGDVVVVPVMRRGRAEREVFEAAVATVFTRDADLDVNALHTGSGGGRRIDLPTYPFQRDRYWLAAPPRTRTRSDGVSAAGLREEDHPLLAAAVEVPGTDTEVWSGRISAADLPWLADHVVWDRGVVPGAALLEMVLQVGSRTGLPRVAELILETPLTWASDRPLQVRIVVAAATSAPGGAREVTLHSRPEPMAAASSSASSSRPAAGERDDDWTRHASGLLAAAADDTARLTGAWPPVGAEPLDLAGQYPLFAAAGVRYEGAFRGLRAAWRRGDEVFADVRLPDAHAVDAARYGVHPALLDAVLHPIALLDPLGDGGHGLLPFSWSDVQWHGAGGHALRVRVAAVDGGAVSVTAADQEGNPVLSARSLALRRITADRLPAAPVAPLHRLDWRPLPGPAPVTAAGRWVVVGPEAEATAGGLRAVGLDARTHVLPLGEPLPPQAGAGAEVIILDLTTTTAAGRTASDGGRLGLLDEVRATVRRALDAVQAPLDATGPDPTTAIEPDPTTAIGTGTSTAGTATDADAVAPRLVVLTRGAAGPEGGAADLAGAAVWGLVRVAQTEQPGRFTLVDIDGTQASLRALPGLLATEAGQLALRDGRATVPRIVPVADPAPRTGGGTAADGPGGGGPSVTLDPEGTVLITGGTGALAAETARHLVERHKVRHLLLVGRRGPDAPGVDRLVAELTGSGAEVAVRACDVTDRDALRRLLGELPDAHPLTCVVHTAGVLDDGVLSAQTPERIDAVLRPKADAAVHLDELTRESGRVPLVLYSSVSATLGSAGQAGYAAANAFLDALAARRCADGHPALSLGWGWWSGVGLATGLAGADAARVRRSGVAPLDAGTALELLDRALTRPEPALLPVRLDPRAAARATVLPEVLRDLAGGPTDAHGRPTDAHGRPGHVPGTGAVAGTGDGGGDGDGAVRRAPAPADAAGALAARLAGRSASERTALLLDLVRGEVAAVLGHGDPAAVGAARSFKEAGFDSLTAVDLRNRLNARTGLRLPATLVFDHPTPLALAELLLGGLAVTGPAEPAGQSPDGPGGAETLSGVIDRLERSLAATDDGEARADAARRLRGLLAALPAGSGAMAGPDAEEGAPGRGDVVIDRLRSATDDDLFDLLDSDFQ
ncbi:SDR family NAD(P)-dependent oxidoreductase, partial [Streptomyces sp. NPDC056568]|uniref:type I polyketide synthase n=1 Tax=Streptomyces sp. NPDC056568 TaxID=3345866 RepID=UPI0036C6ADDD